MPRLRKKPINFSDFFEDVSEPSNTPSKDSQESSSSLSSTPVLLPKTRTPLKEIDQNILSPIKKLSDYKKEILSLKKTNKELRNIYEGIY